MGPVSPTRIKGDCSLRLSEKLLLLRSLRLREFATLVGHLIDLIECCMYCSKFLYYEILKILFFYVGKYIK